jgi:hypothetical protein
VVGKLIGTLTTDQAIEHVEHVMKAVEAIATALIDNADKPSDVEHHDVKIETRVGPTDELDDPCGVIVADGRPCGVRRRFHGHEQVSTHSFRPAIDESTPRCARCGQREGFATHDHRSVHYLHLFEPSRSTAPRAE